MFRYFEGLFGRSRVLRQFQAGFFRWQTGGLRGLFAAI